MNSDNKNKLLFALCIIIIFIFIVLVPDQRGVIAGILIAVGYLLYELLKDAPVEKFEAKPPQRVTSKEKLLPVKSFCDGYQGAVECGSDEEEVEEEANLDNKGRKLAHDRFRFKREVDGVTSKNKMKKYLEEEVVEAERDRWEGNDD